MSRASKDSLPAWDLSDLFESPEDPAIARLLKTVNRQAKAFQKNYKGKLSTLGKKPAQFLSVFKSYEEILQDLGKPYMFAHLMFAESSADPKRGAFLQRMQQEYVQTQKFMMFF
ncbi:MAG: hypothetical protein KDD62_16315, partial [Bdellovibrionales bacterium]|nr:hypothetical protein [Bdellovibrionales bacterium]